MQDMTQRQFFYLVWNPRKEFPKKRHATAIEAIAEAERLAEKYPGHHFYVLTDIGHAVIEPPKAQFKFTIRGDRLAGLNEPN